MTTPSSVVSTLGRSSTAVRRGSGVPAATPGTTSPTKNPPGKTTGASKAKGPRKGRWRKKPCRRNDVWTSPLRATFGDRAVMLFAAAGNALAAVRPALSTSRQIQGRIARFLSGVDESDNALEGKTAGKIAAGPQGLPTLFGNAPRRWYSCGGNPSRIRRGRPILRVPGRRRAA